jgi:hypothetical protein
MMKKRGERGVAALELAPWNPWFPLADVGDRDCHRLHRWNADIPWS